MSRRWMAALLAALTMLSLCACGGGHSAAVPMADLQQSMLSAAPSLPEMKSVSDEDADAAGLFAYLSDLDYGKVEHFFLSYSAKGLADEIAVIALKDPADADAASASLRHHLKERSQMYGQYQPDQLKRVQDAQLFTQDQYVVLIVCDEADAVKDAFMKITAAG